MGSPISPDAFSTENHEVLDQLVTTADFADGFTILFASVNAPAQRQQLMDVVEQRLAERNIRVRNIAFEREIINLRQHLRTALAADSLPEQTTNGESPEREDRPLAVAEERAPDGTEERKEQSTKQGAKQSADAKLVLFVTGLEKSIPYATPEARLLAELNLGRELFLRDAPHPIIFWLPDYAITAIARYALDFWAWRSGIFEFKISSEARQHFYQRQTADSDWLTVDNLGAEQKMARRSQLESLLDSYSQLAETPRIQQERKDILFSLAQIHQSQDELPQAIRYYDQYLALCRQLDDRQGEGWALGNLGDAYADLGRVEEAIEKHEAALIISREIGDRRGEGNHLGNLGNVYADQGRVEEAIKKYEAALIISQEIGDRRNEGNWLGNLGNAYRNQGRVEEAIEKYEAALLISREIGDRRGEGNHLGNLGNAYRNQGRVEEAIEKYEAALLISREIGDRRGEGVRLGNLGLAYADLGRVEEAIEKYQAALIISREIGDRRGEGIRLGSLGNAYADLGRVEEAIEKYQAALIISREIGDRHNEGIWLGNLGLTYTDLGRADEAKALWQQALTIFEEIKSPNAEWVRQLLADLEDDEKIEAAA